ncbi:MAG: MOSC domain-containing protein [Haloarculaceae archaeon]
MPTLSQIAVHPIKALDPVDRETAPITAAGGLDGDRAYAVVTEEGDYVNGKRTAAVHRLRASVDLDAGHVTLRVQDQEAEHRFHLDRDRAALEAWLSDYFETPVSLSVGQGGTQTDSAVYGDGTRTGPTLISAATLREVASWYEGMDATEVRLRMRPNLVVEGVPAFWEDRLAAGRRVRIGDVTLAGVKSVPRCVVPTRDPHTGAVTPDFRETFVEKRAETAPEWTGPATFEDGYYRLMAVTRIPEPERDGALDVGDPVRLADADA